MKGVKNMTDIFMMQDAKWQGYCNSEEKVVRDLVNSEYYTEAADSKKQSTGKIAQLKKQVSDFFKKLFDTITGFFSKKEIKKAEQTKVNKNGKIKLSAKNQQLIDQGKITLKELEKCKNSDDMDKAMNRYRAKTTAIKAGAATITITAVAALAWLKGRSQKELEKYKAEQGKLEQQIKELEASNASKSVELASKDVALSNAKFANEKMNNTCNYLANAISIFKDGISALTGMAHETADGILANSADNVTEDIKSKMNTITNIYGDKAKNIAKKYTVEDGDEVVIPMKYRAQIQASYNNCINWMNESGDDLYCEGGITALPQAFIQKIKDFFDAIIGAIESFFESIRDGIADIKRNIANDRISKSANTQIEIPRRYFDLIELCNDTLDRLNRCNKQDQCDYIMTRYDRNRAAIKMSTATKVIRIADAMKFIEHSRDTEVSNLYKRRNAMMKESYEVASSKSTAQFVVIKDRNEDLISLDAQLYKKIVGALGQKKADEYIAYA
jgi:valyl-tRNA synthetase